MPTPLKNSDHYLVTLLALLVFLLPATNTRAATPPVTVITPDTVLSQQELQTSYSAAYRSGNGLKAAVLKELIERHLGGTVTVGQLDQMMRQAEEIQDRVGHARFTEQINLSKGPIQDRPREAVGLPTGRTKITTKAVRQAVDQTLAETTKTEARVAGRKLLKGGGALLILWALPQISRAAVQSASEGDPTALIGAGTNVALELSPAGPVSLLSSSTGHQNPLGQPQLVLTVNFAAYDLQLDLQDRWSLFDWTHPVKSYRCLIKDVSHACTSEGELLKPPTPNKDFIRSIPQLPAPETDRNLGESPSDYPQTSGLDTAQQSGPLP